MKRRWWTHVTVVTGPIAAGKSTYVADHAAPGDIVIDFDRLCRAIGSDVSSRDPVTGKWEHAEHYQKAAYQMWLSLRRHACDYQATPVWLIQSDPPAIHALTYVQRRANVIVIDADTHQPVTP